MLYLRHISFIIFLLAIVVLYKAFFEFSFGKLCLVISFFYIFMTLFAFFIKNNYELNNPLNSVVVIILHLYVAFVSYRYFLIYDLTFTGYDNYFKINFIIMSITMFILAVNKIILMESKK